MDLCATNLSLGGRIDGISLDLRSGEITAIVGPNGAGKSSLLGCLGGLLKPSGGSVSLDGEALSAIPPRQRARQIGFLPQSPEIAWDVSVETLVSLGRLPWQGSPLHSAHASAEQDAQSVAAALSAMELNDLRSRPVSQLSGGERARALAARVLSGEPRWILADEPLANFDLAHASALVRLLRAEAQAGRGVILVLHDLATAMNRADRVIVLDRGKVVADNRPEQALEAALVSQVWGIPARWLGEPGARALAVD